MHTEYLQNVIGGLMLVATVLCLCMLIVRAFWVESAKPRIGMIGRVTVTRLVDITGNMQGRTLMRFNEKRFVEAGTTYTVVSLDESAGNMTVQYSAHSTTPPDSNHAQRGDIFLLPIKRFAHA